MSKKAKIVPRLGAPTNLRPAGVHKDKRLKRQNNPYKKDLDIWLCK